MNFKKTGTKTHLIILFAGLIFFQTDLRLYPGDLEISSQDKLVFTPVLIKSDVPGPVLVDVSEIIQHSLQDDYFFINDRFTPEAGVTFNNYITGRCVTELAKVIPGGIIIMVAVKKGEVKVGEKQHSRYVVEDIIETRYTIYVSTVDLTAGRYDLRFRETVNDTVKLTDKADNIGKKIREFYIMKKPDGNPGAEGAVNGL